MCRYEYTCVETREKPAVLFLSLFPPFVLRQSFSLGGQITSVCNHAQLFTCVLRPYVHVLMLVPQALYQMAYLQPREVIFLFTLASGPQDRNNLSAQLPDSSFSSPSTIITLSLVTYPTQWSQVTPLLPSLWSCFTAWKRWEKLPLSSAPTYRSESHDFVLERMEMR